MGEAEPRLRKRNVRLLAGLFVALLVALTLGGNTIRALSLPKVITAAPTAGSLDYSYEGSATVRPAVERDLTNPAGWSVLEVLVQAGDTVHQGQPLVRYDDSDAQDQLADLQSSLKKLKLSLEQLQYNVKTALKGEDEEAKLSASAALEAAKLDIADQERRIGKQQKDIAAGRELKAPIDGIVTAVGVKEGVASSGLPDVRLADSSKGYRIQLTIPGELASKLNLGETLDSIALKDDASRLLTGTISAIEEASGGGGVDLVGGAEGGSGGRVGGSGDGSGGLTGGAGSDGVVGGAEGGSGGPAGGSDGGADDGYEASGSGNAPASLLTVALQDDGLGLQGGERVTVKIRRAAGEGLLLVPNEAVHHDSQGAFVYTIAAKQGPLGNAYYANETRIETAGSNDYATAVRSGLFEQDEVIVANTGLLMSGTRVRY